MHEGQLLKQFAKVHRLRTVRDSCGELIVSGRDGQIHEDSDNELAVMYIPGLIRTKEHPEGRGQGAWRPKQWNIHKRAAQDIGMTLRQNCDNEGSLSFDPKNVTQGRLAIKIARAHQKRRMSETQLAQFDRVRVSRTAKKSPG